MVPDSPPTAEGELAQTPFAHLVVFALDRRLTGEMFLSEPSGTVHALRFVDGQAVKIRVSDDFCRLGDLLCEAGKIERSLVESAVLAGGLLGDMLVLSGNAESADVDQHLELQYRRRMQRCFALAGETTYRYFEQSQTLADWGGDPHQIDPLEILWAGLAEHAENSQMMEATLDKLGDVPLKLHGFAPTNRMMFDDDGETVVELLLLEPMSLQELCALESPDPAFVRRVIYAMTIARQLELGRNQFPVGVDPASASPQSVARVRLRSTATRRGVAVDVAAKPLRSLSVRGRVLIPREESEPPPPVEPIGVGRIVDVSGLPTTDPAAHPEANLRLPPPPPDPSAADPAAADLSGLEPSGLDRPGLEPSGLEPSGLEPSGLEPSGLEPSGLEPSGLEPSGLEPSGLGEIPAEPATATAAAAPASGRPAPLVDEPSAGEESSRRMIADAVRELSHEGLLKLAQERLDEHDPKAANEIYTLGLSRLEEEGKGRSNEAKELRAAAVWAQALEPQAELKALLLELDALIRHKDDLALVRLVRSRLRKKLGDNNGALSDLRRVLELDPDNAEAKAQTKNLSVPPAPQAAEGGFLKRLFRR